jgi:hypothetical protein
MAQFARPVADSPLFATVWTPSPNFVQIAELIADSGGTVMSPTTDVIADVTSIQLDTVLDPGVSTGHVMRVQLGYQNTDLFGDQLDVTVNLYQGDPFGTGSFVAALDVVGGFVVQAGAGDLSYTTFTYTLSAPEADSITDYSDLWIAIGANNGSEQTVAPWGPGAAARWLRVSFFELEVPASSICTWWTPDGPGGADGPFGGWFQEICSPTGLTPPSDFSFDFGFFWDGIFYPPDTVFTWTSTTDPGDKGWWFDRTSFNGAAVLAVNARPKNPRGFTEITTFATGSAGVFGGFPGAVGNFENKMIYAPGGYTVGTDQPTIRIFDGVSDHELATIPKTSAGAVPKAIVSILVANGTVYLGTLDSGTTSANWAGRVFELDVESGNLTPIGPTFSGGHFPYALAWHNGRLWAGSNTGDPTVHGKVYYFRPDIDTSWTVDKTLSDGCVCSMISYKGLLYVGCSGSNGTFAKVLVRGTDTTYSTSLTATGGTAKTNNAFLSMVEFDENLYASYWNPDTPTAISRIRKFDNTTWSSVYAETNDSIFKPWQAFPNDSGYLLAIAGGVGYAASLISTTDGTTWTDNTVFLTQSGTTSTGLPAWGVVVR